MKAVVIHQYGGPEVLRFEDYPDPVPAEGFAVGDRVLAWAYHTYAELCVMKAELLAKVPNGLDLIEAAALPLVTMTGTQIILVGKWR